MDQKQIQMLPLGTLLQEGRYRVERYIASGGFGNTYEVVHTRLGKRMALKEFFMRGINLREGTTVSVSMEDNRATFEQMRDKFFKEAQRLAQLEDLHIVEVNDFFEENQTAYYVMKLIDGESLSAMMKHERHPFTEQEARQVLPQVLSALKTVHCQGIYHLDLKPGNIMSNGHGHCWLIDFGASKQLYAAESLTLSTSTGLCYTPGFAPSEQISGNIKRIGPWTDFYALGATIYNLLTAQQPPEVDDVMYDGDSAFSFPLSVSQEMQRLVLWLMQYDYRKRPKSVEEIEHRLNSSFAEKPLVNTNPRYQPSTETFHHSYPVLEEAHPKHVVLNPVDIETSEITVKEDTGNQQEVEKKQQRVFVDEELYPIKTGGFLGLGGKWGYADKDDNIVIPCVWNDAFAFSEGLALVKNDDGLYGFIDKCGNEVSPCKWREASSFHEGLACVENENRLYGYIDTTGEEVIPCQWYGAYSFMGGIARVKPNNWDEQYIDKTGKVVK